MIDRVMQKFADRYTEAHPDTFASPDTAFILAFSLIMLNTDAHSDQIPVKMTLDQFINNNKGIGADGTNLPAALLTTLYHSIQANEIILEQREYIKSVRTAPGLGSTTPALQPPATPSTPSSRLQNSLRRRLSPLPPHTLGRCARVGWASRADA